MYTYMPIYVAIILKVKEVCSVRRDMRVVRKKIWREAIKFFLIKVIELKNKNQKLK